MLFNFYDTARFAKEFLIDVPLLPLNEKNIAADTTLTEVSAAAFINNIPCFNYSSRTAFSPSGSIHLSTTPPTCRRLCTTSWKATIRL